jgi:hypothetical protein
MISTLFSQIFSPQTRRPVSAPLRPVGHNPFMSYKGNSIAVQTYAKNTPVRGGYFAGYYNGRQNIVGQRLFIEV